MSNLDVLDVVSELRQAVEDCSDRCLTGAADWASELLTSIPCAVRQHVQNSFRPKPSFARAPGSTSTPLRPNAAGDASTDSAMDLTEELPARRDAEADDPDRIRRAQILFARKEIWRAGELVRGSVGNVGKFLCLYARYLMSDKRAGDHHQNVRGKWTPAPINPELNTILAEIGTPTDAFLLFLKGTVLFQLKKRVEAIEFLILSLKQYPCNWSCWVQLGLCIDNAEEFTRLQALLPNHFMTRIFTIKISNDLYTASTDDTVNAVSALLATFSESSFLKGQKALVFFNVRECEEAERIFDEIQATDPHRINDMDLYSNVLYILEKATKLGDVARRMAGIDRSRPEVCCLIGNYYSMRGDHEKAVQYFRRALALDKLYTAAWTLLGHEYLELKNPHAAIEAYRRGVDVNRKDYRAWYGLGLAYELLDMPHYSLHYWQRATALRPYDARMWQALATCYTAMKRPNDALQCLKRALLGEDADQIQLYARIATLLDSNGEKALATTYHRKIVAACSVSNKPISEYSKSLLALAQSVLESPSPQGLREALEWMEQLRESSCEEAGLAADMMKKLNLQLSSYVMQAEVEGVQPALGVREALRGRVA